MRCSMTFESWRPKSVLKVEASLNEELQNISTQPASRRMLVEYKFTCHLVLLHSLALCDKTEVQSSIWYIMYI